MITTEELRHMLKEADGNYQAVADRIGTTRQNVYSRLNYTGTPEYKRQRKEWRRKRKATK